MYGFGQEEALQYGKGCFQIGRKEGPAADEGISAKAFPVGFAEWLSQDHQSMWGTLLGKDNTDK